MNLDCMLKFFVSLKTLAEMCVCYVAELDVCSHALSLAYTIITEEKYKVKVIAPC